MIRLSASSLARVEKCPASASLPRVPQLHADAEAGTAAHATHEAACPDGELAEAAFALNPETGKARFLGCGLKRDYPVDWNTEIPGTADRVGPAEVRDYKSGFGYMVAAPAENLQLAHNALCVADVQGVDAVSVSIDRSDTPGKPVVLDAFALAEARERIRKIWRAANAPTPAIVMGDHCWRCECLPNCPPHLTMAIAFSEGMWPGILPSDGLTVEGVARAWDYLKAAKRLLGLVEKTYRAFASAQPVDLGGGRVLGEHTVDREEIDGPVARQVLRDLHGPAVADAATEMEITKASLERALASIAPPRGKSRLVRDALLAIGAANGIRVNKRVCVEEYQPKGATDGVD